MSYYHLVRIGILSQWTDFKGLNNKFAKLEFWTHTHTHTHTHTYSIYIIQELCDASCICTRISNVYICMYPCIHISRQNSNLANLLCMHLCIQTCIYTHIYFVYFIYVLYKLYLSGYPTTSAMTSLLKITTQEPKCWYG